MEGNRKARENEPPTLAFRLKAYKAAIQQLRCVVRSLKESTTVTFLPTPALVVQTVKPQYVSKIVFNSSCLYITNRDFMPKTINNAVPIVGNLMYLTSNRELTKFSVKDDSDLSARICMSAADYHMEISTACVHHQDLVRETGDSVARVDLDPAVVLELIKWIAPHIRPKRNSKKQTTSTNTVQLILHASPPTVKWAMAGAPDLEFKAANSVAFHEVKNLRLTVQAKNLHQALCQCIVTKLACTLRVIVDHESILYIGSKNSAFGIENFLSEEPFVRPEIYERPSHGQREAVGGSAGGAGAGAGAGAGSGSGSVACGGHLNSNAVGTATVIDDLDDDESAGAVDFVGKKHDRGSDRSERGSDRSERGSDRGSDRDRERDRDRDRDRERDRVDRERDRGDRGDRERDRGDRDRDRDRDRERDRAERDRGVRKSSSDDTSGAATAGKDKYEQHKITSFMVGKSLSGLNGSSDRGGTGGAPLARSDGYFNDAKEESDSDDDSVTFEYTPNAKKQKC